MMFVTMPENEVKDIQDKFDSLTFKQQKAAIKGALTSSASILKRQTARNVDAAPFRKNDQIKGMKGVRHKNRIMSAESSFATVYLYSWNRILEGGTVLRTTKKGYNRGTIKGYHFFRDAKQQTENQVFSEMENNLLKSIHKRWNRNQK